MNSSSANTQEQQAGKVRDLLVTRNGRKERLSSQIVHLQLNFVVECWGPG